MDALRLQNRWALRGYGQKDPLIEYKNEGYDMFLEMMTQVRRNVIYSMFMFQPQPAPAQEDEAVVLSLSSDPAAFEQLLIR